MKSTSNNNIDLSLLSALTISFDKHKYSVPPNSKGISKQSLIEFIASRKPTTNGALGYSSAQGWTKFIKKVFPDKPKGTNYYDWLLYKDNLKFCPRCEKVKILDSFWKNSNKPSSYNSYCTRCIQPLNTKAHRSIQAKRRAAKLQSTPKWANLDKIKNIYDNCPIGYHVDHIIPLQGKYICGLHVENNLQYLTASENASKKNYHHSEECWRPIAAIGTDL